MEGDSDLIVFSVLEGLTGLTGDPLNLCKAEVSFL